MIVVDTNILVYLALPSTFTEHAERLLVREPVWAAPSLWRSEFRNVLARYVQKSIVPLSKALVLYENMEEILGTESKQVTHQGQKSRENSQNNDPKNALKEIEISILLRAGKNGYCPSAPVQGWHCFPG
ncbi:MAG: type II toxin-antitoxin system VapC family toxin [Holosporales bacterium]